MFNYPNGKKFNNLNKIPNKKEINLKASYSAANRGMNLEESINISNDWRMPIFKPSNCSFSYQKTAGGTERKTRVSKGS